jgi:CSLREA domain-containing protein
VATLNSNHSVSTAAIGVMTRSGRLVSAMAVVTALSAIPIGARSVYAATFTVNSTADDVDAAPGNGVCATATGVCTLRAAIQETNARSGADTIVLPAGTYTLTRLPGAGSDTAATGDLDISDTLTIQGGNLLVKGSVAVVQGVKSWNDRVFHVRAAGTLQMSRVVVQGGNTAGSGGGIRVESGGSLTLVTSSVRNNIAQQGGGVSNAGTFVSMGSPSGQSIITGNSAQDGGGIRNESIGTMTLTSSAVSDNVASQGPGGIGNVGTLTLTGSSVSGNTGVFGGGIASTGPTNVINSAIFNNTATQGGGGIDNCDATMTLDKSLVSGNEASENGGGIRNCGALTVTNSTFSGNVASGSGAGIFNFFDGTVNLNNVTMTNNGADIDGSGVGNGGGVANRGAPACNSFGTCLPSVTVSNTIVAGNGSNNPTSRFPDCDGALNNQGFNLIQTTTGCSLGLIFGDIIGRDPLLGPLQYNGGSWNTHALLSGSPAIDAGNPPGGVLGIACTASDQRGVSRPQDGNGDGTARCDIGAFEVSPVGAFELDSIGATIRVGDHLTYRLTYTITNGRSWRELSTIEVRFRDAQGTVLSLLYEEVTGAPGLFSLANPGNDHGFAPQSRNRLETSAATVYLQGTQVAPNVPDPSSVALTFDVSFKPQAAGRTYNVEIIATDDSGRRQGPELAGTLEVER